MPEFKLHVGQHFDCTYIVKADTAEEAWEVLIDDRDAECVEQFPGEITSDINTSGFAVRNTADDDWEDIG